METVKKLFFLALVVGLMSCSKDDDVTLNDGQATVPGTWKLTEQLMDPGDGSGTFTPVESDKLLVLFGNETYLSNGTFCGMSSLADGQTTGTFSVDDEILLPDNCQTFAPLNITFEVSGNELIVRYQCIEGCAQKYRFLSQGNMLGL